VIVAASLGNAMEWFDFLVYGYFAVTIAKVFFPTTNETASLERDPIRLKHSRHWRGNWRIPVG
jgi:hypothetical protein